ncbi:hypothetical protein AWP86_28025 [Escherichia coli]|nr:hypothetical protein AWP86_28025 [Escherichia coli]
MDLNGRDAWSTALSNTCNFTLSLIRVSASPECLFACMTSHGELCTGLAESLNTGCLTVQLAQ